MKFTKRLRRSSVLLLAGLGCLLTISAPERIPVASATATAQGQVDAAGVYNVRAFGATGDGKTIDTAAINKAIDAAAAAGGGTVRFPAGNSCRLSIT